MNMRRIGVTMALGMTAIFAGLGGCPQSAGTDTTGNTTGTTPNSLSDIRTGERDAIQAAIIAAQSLSVTTSTTHAGASRGDTQSALDNGSTPDLTVGTCPETTFSASGTAGTLSLSLDFGAGCTTTAFEAAPDCRGTVSGTITPAQNSTELTFDNFSCGTDSVSGDVNVEYALSTGISVLNGTWKLTWLLDGKTSYEIDGNGEVQFDATDGTIIVPSVAATVATGGDEWNVSVVETAMSFPTYENFVPYAGSVEVYGTDIRGVIVKFDTSSPTTGIVQVSIGGSPFFEVNLGDL